MPADSLFGPIFVPAAVREAVEGKAWLQALLDVERALGAAEARLGVIPAAAAEAIAACCRADRFDIETIVVEGRRVGNPVEPLVRALREQVGEDTGRYVHWGATSQDVLDSATALVARRALEVIVPDLEAVATACASLADEHRSTVMAARTLLQHAVPTTFGLKAAGWLVAVLESRHRLLAVRDERLVVQLGGAAGTLAALGERGVEVLRAFAEELAFSEPVLPWHANRLRIAELGGALDLVAGALAKIALDVTLLAQTEVGELVLPPGGGSSTMPQKRNPVGPVLAAACARQVHGLTGILTAGLAHEHERATGAWHAEWLPLSDALALTGGAAAAMRETLAGIEVDPSRMRRNLDLTGGATLAEREVFLPAPDTETALDPSGYLGSADAFVERALALFRHELGR